MFRAEPTPEPTEPRITGSPYERKFVTTRPTTPIKDEPMLSPAITPKPGSSTLPPPADTTSPPSVSKTLAWKLPKRDWFGTTPTPIQRHFKIPKRSPSPPPPRGPSPPQPPTPPSPSSRASSPGPLPPQANPIQGDEEFLQGQEPTVFNGDREKTDGFLHELRLYQFVNATHPIMTDPRRKVAHALTYMEGPEVYEWKRDAEVWILSNPTPSDPQVTVYDDFKFTFIESWTDTNEPYRAAAELDQLQMEEHDVNTFITVFAELAQKALYHEDDPAVLEKFKAGLPLDLLEPCMQHDDPRNWEAWTRSARKRQAILTSIKTHRPIEPPRTSSPMERYSLSPSFRDSSVPMEIDKMTTIPMRRTSSEEERRRGLCHLCKERGHILLRSSPKRGRSRILESQGYRARVSRVSVNPSCRVSKWTRS